MNSRGAAFRPRRGVNRGAKTGAAETGRDGVVEPLWRDLRDALPVLRRVSRAIGGESGPDEIVTECLQTISRLAGAEKTVMLVGVDELVGLLGEEAADAESVELAPGAELVTDGPVALTITDWEGNARPVLLEHGARLVLPLTRGGAVVEHPEVGIMMDSDRLTAMEILLDWAVGVIGFATEISEIERRSSELEETRRRLREQTMLLSELTVVDELTGLYNRRYFERQLAFELERFTRYGRALSLAMLDVDFFKKINDGYGHPMGDLVLKRLSEVGLHTMRNVDLLARVGGEEFALLMPETDHDGAMVACRRLLENVRNTDFTDGEHHLRVTLSIGLATVTHPWSGDPESLVRMADQALYRAKESGRDRIVAAVDSGTSTREETSPSPSPSDPSSTT